jgi:hypothetical protein
MCLDYLFMKSGKVYSTQGLNGKPPVWRGLFILCAGFARASWTVNSSTPFGKV